MELTGGQQSTNTFRVMMGFRTSNPYGVFFSTGTVSMRLFQYLLIVFLFTVSSDLSDGGSSRVSAFR